MDIIAFALAVSALVGHVLLIRWHRELEAYRSFLHLAAKELKHTSLIADMVIAHWNKDQAHIERMLDRPFKERDVQTLADAKFYRRRN